jgi:GGDEF domain-containing protein
MAQATQTDPYAKYGGSIADDSDIEQPMASVRAPSVKVGDYYPINGQDAYVSGFDSKQRPMLSPGKPPAQQADPYAKYGGSVAPTADPYAKYNQPSLPPMTRPQADAFFTNLATGGQGTYQPPKTPKFADVAYVDPESRVFGEPIKSAIHPDTTGGRNLVPIQNVAAVRQQMQYEAQHPEEMARVAHSQAMDTSLPLGERLRARSGLEVRKRVELGEATNAVNEKVQNYAGEKGANAGEAFAQFMAHNFQTENPEATPGEIGVARSVGKNVAQTVASPITYATLPLGATGKAGQVALSTLFAAGAGKASYDAAGQLGSIWDRDDISRQQKTEMASDLLINTAMAGLAGSHAVKVSFLTPNDSLLSQIPQEYRKAVKGRVNSIISSTGGVLSRTASTAGDLMAAVGNADRENIPSGGVPALRKALPKVPVASAQTALPLVKSVADQGGYNTVSAEDLLDSAPDENGAVHPGLISQAKTEVIAEAGRAAGPGQTISDLTPQQVRPFLRQLDALDDLHDHIQAAREKETTDLQKATDKGKLPQSSIQALGRIATGGGKYAFARSVGAAIPFGGPMTRAALNAAGIGGGFGDLVAGVKYFLKQGGKLSPTLDDNLSAALGKTRPSDIALSSGTDAATREAGAPYQGDTSVQHEYVTVPPETPHGVAPLLRDEPNPRFQLSSTSTLGPLAARQARSLADIFNGQPPQQFTAVRAGVTPELQPKQVPLTASVPSRELAGSVTAARQSQRSLMDILSGRAEEAQRNGTPNIGGLGDVETGVPSTSTQGMSMPSADLNAGGMVSPASHPETIITRGLQRAPKARVFATAKELGIPVSAADSHQTLIPKIMDRLFELDAQPETAGLLDAYAEHMRGLRGEIPAGPEAATPDNTDLTDVMARSVEEAQAKKGQQPQRGFMDVMRGPTEQRQNLDYRAKVDAMNPADREKAIYISDLTGLPNKRAFKDFSNAGLAATHPHVGYADIDDFRKVNDALGHEGADAVLSEIGTLFAQAQAEENGAVHTFHRSGDEFWFRASDPEAISRVVNRVNDALAKTKFTFVDSAGREVEQKGIGLSHGTGSDVNAAEAAAAESKQLRKQQGLRTGARDQAEVRTLGTPSSAGANAEVNNVSQRQGVSGVNATPETSGAAQGLLTPPAHNITPAANFRRGDVGYVDPKEVELAPQEFQFKLNTNERGITNQFAENKFNEDLAGVVNVFRRPESGRLAAVNGHHRTALAQSDNAPRLLIHVLDVNTPEEARAVGALQNIAEGQGTPTDAAKFFRDSGLTPADLKKMGVSLSASKVESGLALSKLDPSIFHKVATGQMSEGRGVAIGSATDDPAQQEAIMQLITRAENRGKTVTDATVAELSRQVKNAGLHSSQNDDLFGSMPRVSSLAVEKAEVSAYIKKQLGQEKRVFGSVAKEGTAQTLGRVKGQQIVASENAAISQQAAQGLEAYDKLSAYKGPIDTILERAARRLADGDNAAKVKQDAYEAIRTEISKTLPGQ